MTTTPEPSVNDLNPIAPSDIELEPALLLDTTGSMDSKVTPGSGLKRRELAHDVFKRIVGRLAELDSQAETERETDDDAGGVRVTTFADGRAHDLGDINTDNFEEKWGQIRWGGGTWLMPGLKQVQDTFLAEFGTRGTAMPRLMLIVLTDGEAQDTPDFAEHLGAQHGNSYVVLGITGYGDEHDDAFGKYKQVEAKHGDHLRVLTFAGREDAEQIANELMAVAGVGAPS